MAENKTLEHLPEVRAAVAALSPEDRELLAAVQTSPFKLTAPEQFKEFAANIDYFVFEPNIHNLNDLGWRYLAQHMDMQNYIDYEAYGRDVALEENGTFTDQGYVRDTGDSFHEYYDGERGSIPDEYRVMTFQDDLPEEEKSEWAMDIAFDMDEFSVRTIRSMRRSTRRRTPQRKNFTKT